MPSDSVRIDERSEQRLPAEDADAVAQIAAEAVEPGRHARLAHAFPRAGEVAQVAARLGRRLGRRPCRARRLASIRALEMKPQLVVELRAPGSVHASD